MEVDYALAIICMRFVVLSLSASVWLSRSMQTKASIDVRNSSCAFREVQEKSFAREHCSGTKKTNQTSDPMSSSPSLGLLKATLPAWIAQTVLE